jgi:hypothetical protein
MANVKFTDNSDKFKQELAERVPVILEGIGIEMERAAKKQLEASPRRVDTGLLRNSITHAVSGQPAAIQNYHASYGSNRITKGKNKGKRRSASAKNAGSVGVGFYVGNAPEESNGEKAVYVGTNVEYGVYVHEGTVRMAPNRFLRNAVERNADQVKKYIEDGLKGP